MTLDHSIIFILGKKKKSLSAKVDQENYFSAGLVKRRDLRVNRILRLSTGSSSFLWWYAQSEVLEVTAVLQAGISGCKVKTEEHGHQESKREKTRAVDLSLVVLVLGYSAARVWWKNKREKSREIWPFKWVEVPSF